MPQYQPVVIADGESTPVNHTYDIRSLSNGRLIAVNRAAPTIETQEILGVEVKGAASSKGTSKVRITLGMPHPVTNTDTGETEPGEVNSVVMEFNFAPTSTFQRRKNLRTLAMNLLANAAVAEAIDDVEPYYG
jgi:hypothetical protein